MSICMSMSAAIIPYFMCSGELSSVHQENPLYEEQEIRMDMFNEGSDEETEGRILLSLKFILVHQKVTSDQL